jgi:hypothetical protein
MSRKFRRSTVDMVRYCPGSAPGSPAGLPNSRAKEQLERDYSYVAMMVRSGSISDPVYPHIGICPNGCPHNPDGR